jgi:hypothetical protein
MKEGIAIHVYSCNSSMTATKTVFYNSDGDYLIVPHKVAVLCCAVLCSAVLCCALLCSAVLCCAVLCCAVLCCAVLCCAVLCCAVLCCALSSYLPNHGVCTPVR